MDGRAGVFLVAATNRPDIIDPALLRCAALARLTGAGSSSGLLCRAACLCLPSDCPCLEASRQDHPCPAQVQFSLSAPVKCCLLMLALTPTLPSSSVSQSPDCPCQKQLAGQPSCARWHARRRYALQSTPQLLSRNQTQSDPHDMLDTGLDGWTSRCTCPCQKQLAGPASCAPWHARRRWHPRSTLAHWLVTQALRGSQALICSSFCVRLQLLPSR